MASYLEYARRGANAWWRYLVGFALALFLAAALGTVGFVVLTLLHAIPGDLEAQALHADRPGFFLFNGVVFALLVVGFWLAGRWLHRKRFADLLGAWTWRGFAVGFGLWIGVQIGAALIDFALAPAGFAYVARPDLARWALLVLPALAIQTFAEEFVFRGYVTQGLMANTGRPGVSAVVSGLLFGAIHIANGAPAAVSATVFGVAAALIAIRTGGIAFTYGLHLANNLFVALVLVSAGDAFRGSPSVFTQDTPHLQWWDAGVGAVSIVLLALVLVWRQRKTGSAAQVPKATS